ncbi:2986_t:CDS:2, partial [Paraglomus occultum]
EATRSPNPIKLSIVNDKKNNIVKDLRDFVDLNLCALAKKEGVDTVLHNATMTTQKRIDMVPGGRISDYFGENLDRNIIHILVESVPEEN